MPNKAGARIAARLTSKRHGGPLPPEVFDGERGLPLLRQRARAGFVQKMNLLERIAEGDFEQRVTTTGPDGKKTVTTYTPSAKDRMQALKMLGEYGHVPVSGGQGGGGPADLATLTRAVLGALSDPVVRRALANDPELGETVRLLGAEDVTAYAMPGDDELNEVTATEYVIEPSDVGTGQAHEARAEGHEASPPDAAEGAPEP